METFSSRRLRCWAFPLRSLPRPHPRDADAGVQLRCAVFLQSDIINFQRQGWRPEEIIAGLAAVLPKNVFLYVAGVSNVARLGRRFLLQGGTQRNLAVVKAEVDFLRSHFFADGAPEVRVHPHCGEAGAMGAALQAIHS